MLLKFIRKLLGIEYLITEIADIKINVREIYWANIFNSTIQDSKWINNKSFSPGRWAVNYSFLFILYRILNDVKPKNIIEFGLGQSSKMTLSYHSYFKNSTLKIIEHNYEWVEYFKNIYMFDLTNIIHMTSLEDKIVNGEKSLSYKNIPYIIKNKKYNLIIIDGPFGSDRYARSQLLEFIDNDSLDQYFIVIIDDYNRKGEKETVEIFIDMLNKKKIKYYIGEYHGEKDQCVIC